ncbi:MAG: imidazole glycerol phosphate synthase subunit HisF [Nanoarchaeota archaeon]|nr:imidazole glycerol phosphate synthase subunit HisF [Nanoarchaeota archaeon]
MLTKRIIACLDMKGGKVVKGTRFKRLKIVGDPIVLAEKYYRDGADELCFLDISASIEKRKTRVELVRKIAEKIRIPFTVGGGIKSVEEISGLLRAGADKIALCTQAILDPGLIIEASRKFGSQCIVVSIDAKKTEYNYEAYIYGGKKRTGLDAVLFAKQCELFGAGELLVNSIDRDGTQEGYDLELLRNISGCVKIPVIASSGAGNPSTIFDALEKGKADAALVASILHNSEYNIQDIKKYLKKNKVNVR